jgi:hypothetical protein
MPPMSEHGPNHIPQMTRSAWDESFASSAEYGLGHVTTKATTEVVRSSPSYETTGERDDAESLEHVVLNSRSLKT